MATATIIAEGVGANLIADGIANTSVGHTAINDVTNTVDNVGNDISNFFKFVRLPKNYNIHVIKSKSSSSVNTLYLNDLCDKYTGDISYVNLTNNTGGTYTVIDSDGNSSALSNGSSTLFRVHNKRGVLV